MPRNVKANRVIMHRRNEVIFEGKHVWASLATVATKDLADTLDELAGDEVEVTFSVPSEDYVAQDRKTYGRRIAKLTGWDFSGWSARVHEKDGERFVHPTHQIGILTRKS